VVRHLLTSQHPKPNAFGARVSVPTLLLTNVWRILLPDYHDNIVAEFLAFGCPINYTVPSLPSSTSHNHPSATQYDSHVREHINTELHWQALAGPIDHSPFPQPTICSLLQTVPKRGSTSRRVVMDLSFPPGHLVNNGIPSDSYLGDAYKLHLPGIDRLMEFILQKGRGCLIFKKDLRRAYRQFPIDPKDYHLLGFCYDGKLYFNTCCPFGLHSSAMICQRSTSAVVHIFTKTDFLADVYLDDFYGAEIASHAKKAFDHLGDLFLKLGLDSSPEDCPPATTMVCLGILVNTTTFTLEVLAARVMGLLTQLRVWTKSSSITKKQLQSLLGKLSFVTACVKPGRICMACLLNRLEACNAASHHRYSITNDMQLDIQWWLHFLPQFNRVSLIKPFLWDFQCFNFATDASLCGGGATCRSDCIRFIFPDDILSSSLHINTLELSTIVVAVKHWALQLQGSKFIISSDNSTAVAVIN